MIHYGPWQKTLTLLLCALALAWGLIPQGGSHSHVGGMDPTHQHDARDKMAHRDSHCHDSGVARHEHAAESDISSLRDSMAHLHWRLLGLTFAVPLPDDPADDAEDCDMVPPTIVRTASQVASGVLVDASPARTIPLAVVPGGLGVVDEWTTADRSPTVVTSIPLCDVARRELCGVLLA